MDGRLEAGTVAIMIENDPVYRSGDKQLHDGETERLIAKAREAQSTARKLGRMDIAEKAQRVIDDLTAKHLAAAKSLDELEKSHEELDAARAQYDVAIADRDVAKAKLASLEALTADSNES